MTDIAPSARLDSGIDVSIGQEDSSDSDILDLDRISLLDDDEERWLCAPKTKCDNKDKDDVLSWLKRKACHLDDRSRQALIRKLDAIAKRSGSDSPHRGNISETDNNCQTLVENCRTMAGKRPSLDSNGSEEDTFFDAVSDHERILHEAIKAQIPGSPPRPQPQLPHDLELNLTKNNYAKPSNKMLVTRPATDIPAEISTPDFLASEASFATYNAANNKPSLVNGHPTLNPQYSSGSSVRSKESSPSPRFDGHELNPELQDIHLLASMQEEDLRQCLERMQLQRRRRTESVNSETGNPVMSNGPAQTGGVSKAALDQLAAALGKNPKESSASRQFKRDDKYRTYSKKSGSAAPVVNITTTPARRSAPTPKGNGFTGPVSHRRISEPKGVKEEKSVNVHNNINTAIYTQSESLQKSLPNLASSKSAELSVARQQGTSSEQGSYNDIPNTLSPSHSAHQVQNTPTRPVNVSKLRMPTPRSRLGTQGKTSIPAPASSMSRFKSPSAVSRLRTNNNNWKDDCF